MGKGGGIAQRGTMSESISTEVLAVAMTPGRRHITKPVCEINYGLRREGIHVDVMVLQAGAGIPVDELGVDVKSSGYGPKFGLTPRELEQIELHDLVLIHMGNVNSHIILKTKTILRYLDTKAVIACEYPMDFEDFARVGIRTRYVMPPPDKIETEGMVVGIVSGIVRGETVQRERLNELAKLIKSELGVV